MSHTFAKAVADSWAYLNYQRISSNNFCHQCWKFSFCHVSFFPNHEQIWDCTEIISTAHQADLLVTAHCLSPRQAAGGCIWTPGKRLAQHLQLQIHRLPRVPFSRKKTTSKGSPWTHSVPTSHWWNYFWNDEHISEVHNSKRKMEQGKKEKKPTWKQPKSIWEVDTVLHSKTPKKKLIENEY